MQQTLKTKWFSYPYYSAEPPDCQAFFEKSFVVLNTRETNGNRIPTNNRPTILDDY